MSALAERIGKSARTVSDYENGVEPPADVLNQLARELGFPYEFFFGDDLELPREDAVSFRALSKMSAVERARALSQGSLGIQLNKWIEEHFDLPESDLPDFSQEPAPEAAAAALRQQWQLGEWPITNMIHLLETKGIRIYSLAVDSLNVDAYSLWSDDRPMIFLNTRKSAERSRFDAAHELGHLVLHRHALKRDARTAEEQANQFASAFLMPRNGVIARAPKFPTIQNLILGKRHWIVSVAAFNYRLHNLGLVNDWQHRMLTAEISKRGYRSEEPNPSIRESSLLLQKVFTALREDSMSRRDLARELRYPINELEQLVFGLVITSIEGGRNDINQSGSPAALRLIHNRK